MEINTRCPHCQGDILITIGKFNKTQDPPIPMETKPPYDSVKCPECDGPMISRNGKYGTFWGCKKYPDCSGTRDSMGRSKAEREDERNKIVDREAGIEQSRGFSFNRSSRVDKVE